VLVLERSNAGLKKLSQVLSEQTSDSSAFLNAAIGRAVAQAVRRWLPTAAARGLFRAACGVCGAQSGTGAGFLQVLRFPLPIIPQIFLRQSNDSGLAQ
jgi:hypothetical protein